MESYLYTGQCVRGKFFSSLENAEKAGISLCLSSSTPNQSHSSVALVGNKSRIRSQFLWKHLKPQVFRADLGMNKINESCV